MKISVYSPLRISFAGGGTDISPFFENYTGAVVNTTIDRGILIRYTDDCLPLELSSRDFLKSSIISSGKTSTEENIIHLFIKNGIKTGKLIINGDAPPGSGLGSSSSLINGLLKIIHTIKKENVNAYELAEESYNLEKDDFNIILGKQDPYAISLGGFKFMKFFRNGVLSNKFESDNDFILKLEKSILLVYTGKTRESSEALREQSLRSSLNDEGTIKNLNLLKNLAYDLKSSVNKEDFSGLCDIINNGWKIKKSLGEKISNEKIEHIMNYARSKGATASRLLGGGSEGFVLLLSDPENIDFLQKSMLSISNFVIRVKFDPYGTRIISPF